MSEPPTPVEAWRAARRSSPPVARRWPTSTPPEAARSISSGTSAGTPAKERQPELLVGASSIVYRGIARSLSLLLSRFFEARAAELRQRQGTPLGEDPAAAVTTDVLLLRHG